MPALYFAEDEVEFLEDYDYVMEETKQSADLPEDGLHPDLCFPYDAAEPEFPEEQLTQLQALADQVEIARLERMEVLLSPETLREEAAVKELSTKFVRGWRHLRSRLVAREYAWLESRDDLFSPASSEVTTKVLPVIWLQHVEQDWTLGVCDIADAFLTVNQQQPTAVNAATATGERIPYALGKVLPGQRDGSLLWHTDFTSWLYEVMPCEAYPCILRTPGPNRVFIMLHVDDMMIAGPRVKAGHVRWASRLPRGRMTGCRLQPEHPEKDQVRPDGRLHPGAAVEPLQQERRSPGQRVCHAGPGAARSRAQDEAPRPQPLWWAGHPRRATRGAQEGGSGATASSGQPGPTTPGRTRWCTAPPRTWRSSRPPLQDNADKFQHNKDLNAARSFNSQYGDVQQLRAVDSMSVGPGDPTEAGAAGAPGQRQRGGPTRRGGRQL